MEEANSIGAGSAKILGLDHKIKIFGSFGEREVDIFVRLSVGACEFASGKIQRRAQVMQCIASNRARL